ncbi:MAG TPA: hypothetical protein VFV90_00770 [Usitatibacter sp.]|nr:hypothetical protein [Usitatibacter sp.]
MTIPSQQPERWLAEARVIAKQLKTNPEVPKKDPLNIGIAFDNGIVNLTIDLGTLTRLEESELAGMIYGLVLHGTPAPQAPCTARSDSPEDGLTRAGPTPAAGDVPAGPPGQSTDGEHRLPAQPDGAGHGERCLAHDCGKPAVAGLRVNLYATKAIQERYGRKVMLSLIFDLPVCEACFPSVTAADLMNDEQWKAFAKVAAQRNSGIIADRAQTEIVMCAFEDPEYVMLRKRIAATRAANDPQPGHSGPTT